MAPNGFPRLPESSAFPISTLEVILNPTPPVHKPHPKHDGLETGHEKGTECSLATTLSRLTVYEKRNHRHSAQRTTSQLARLEMVRPRWVHRVPGERAACMHRRAPRPHGATQLHALHRARKCLLSALLQLWSRQST